MISLYSDKDVIQIVFYNTHKFMIDMDGTDIHIWSAG